MISVADTGLSKLISRATALALLLVLAAALWFALGSPLVAQYAEAQDSIRHSRRLLADYHSLLLQSKSLEQAVAVKPEDGLLVGANPALLAAALEKQTREIIEHSGAKLESVQILPQDDRAERFQAIGLRVVMTADILAFRTLLEAAATNSPRLFIEKVDVRSEHGQRAQTAAADARRGAGDDLQIHCDIIGYARRGES